LDSWFEWWKRKVCVVITVCWGSVGVRWFVTTCSVSKYWFNHNTGSVFEQTHDLMPRHEWKADPILEIRRGVPFNQREITATNACQ
jgi:hypothetical protein